MSAADTLTWHKSACNLCYINCGVELGVSGDGAGQRIVKVRGDADNPRSQGYLCNKAQAIPSYVHHRDRLTTPLRRRADGSHEAIAWDTAIREIAERLGTVVANHGGKSIAAFGGGGQGNHAGGSYAFGFLRALGSRTVFNALSQEKTGDFWLNGHIFGSQMCHTAEDIHHCDLLLVLGANPRLAHGFTNARDQLNGLRKDPQRKLVVVDPRRTETADAADLHIALRPGTDAFLLGALLAELMHRKALDLMVVVDVAYTETAAQADYVLPAASTFEKCEFTLFNFELPTNYFHVRAPVLPPLPGTLPEPEIYGRLARAMGLMPDDAVLDALREAARDPARDPARFGAAFAEAAAADRNVGKLGGQVLYETLGATLPDGTAAAAPLWQACHRLARMRPQAVRQALQAGSSGAATDALLDDGPALGERLFGTVVGARSGAAFSVHTSSWDFIEHADHKLHLAVPQMLDWLRALDPKTASPDPAWPFVLSAGQRRLNNANQILRDPGTRASDPDGALYIHPDDLAALGVADRGAVVVETARARMVLRAKATDSMRRGHVALPHGYGQQHPAADGTRQLVGPPINWLTDAAARDRVADTPHHKHVPVRLQAAPADAVLNTVLPVPAAAH